MFKQRPFQRMSRDEAFEPARATRRAASVKGMDSGLAVFFGAAIAVVVPAVLLRNHHFGIRWSTAAVLFTLLTVWAMSGTGGEQSIWGNVPVVGMATFGAFFVAGLSTFKHRPVLAAAASFAAGFAGLLIGLAIATEIGLFKH
jgi:hypothetical protein